MLIKDIYSFLLTYFFFDIIKQWKTWKTEKLSSSFFSFFFFPIETNKVSGGWENYLFLMKQMKCWVDESLPFSLELPLRMLKNEPVYIPHRENNVKSGRQKLIRSKVESDGIIVKEHGSWRRKHHQLKKKKEINLPFLMKNLIVWAPW